MLLISVAYKRGCDIVFYSSTDEEITLPHEFFSVYPLFHWGDIVKKVLSKAGDSKKRLKSGFGGGGMGDDHIGGLPIEGGVQTFCAL